MMVTCLFAKTRIGAPESFSSVRSSWNSKEENIRRKCSFIEEYLCSYEIQKYLELLLGLFKSLCIRGVDDIDENVGVVKVIPPVRSDLSLAAYVPNIQPEARRLDGLDVEALVGG